MSPKTTFIYKNEKYMRVQYPGSYKKFIDYLKKSILKTRNEKTKKMEGGISRWNFLKLIGDSILENFGERGIEYVSQVSLRRKLLKHLPEHNHLDYYSDFDREKGDIKEKIYNINKKFKEKLNVDTNLVIINEKKDIRYKINFFYIESPSGEIIKFYSDKNSDILKEIVWRKKSKKGLYSEISQIIRGEKISSVSVPEVFEFTTEVDAKVRPIIRSATTLKRDILLDRQREYFDYWLKEKWNISLEDLFEKVGNSDFRFVDYRDFKHDLGVSVGKGFEKLNFEFDNRALSIDDPKLLWDCNCAVPGGSPEECPIHTHELGPEVDRRFSNGFVNIKYDGVELTWKDAPDFWPPSADSFYTFENLEREGILDREFPSVLDIGCGTGFLGILIACKNPSVKNIYLSEWLLTPFIFSKINWNRNKKGEFVTCKPLLGLEFNWLNQPKPSKRFDLCVCSASGLPDFKEFPEIRMNDPVGSTDLLESVIKRGNDFAREVYLSCANITEEEANRAAEEVNADLKQIGETIKVPFRVPPALENEGYLNKLVEERGLEKIEGERYPFWQEFKTYKVVY